MSLFQRGFQKRKQLCRRDRLACQSAHLGGAQLARQIHRIRPGTPVILYTGYGDDIPERELRAAKVCTLARKPVAPAELFALLKTSLKQTHNTAK